MAQLISINLSGGNAKRALGMRRLAEVCATVPTFIVPVSKLGQ